VRNHSSILRISAALLGSAALWAVTFFPTTTPTVQAASEVAAKTPGAQPSTLLPAGFLHTQGSQIVGSDGQFVRIDAVAWYGQNDLNQNTPMNATYPLPNIQANVNAMARAGFNTITLGWNDASLHGSDAKAYLAGLAAVVSAAGKAGMKIILNHHNDEGVDGDGNCLAQQANGLWYDRGPGTNNTDGCGDPGTVTQATFLADWQHIAREFAGNSTVVGFDLDNEPLAYPGDSTWGREGATNLLAMYSKVGSELERLDPGVLIICEGPQNYSGNFLGLPDVAAYEGDLTLAASEPVVLTKKNGQIIRDQVVYSVHLYPTAISAVKADSGLAAIENYNGDWGYLVKYQIAPVWIGEAGSAMNTANDRAWANTLTAYVNGQDGQYGGPTFVGSEQGISTTWWSWGNFPQGSTLVGAETASGGLRSPQFSVYSQWHFTPTQMHQRS